MEKQCIGNVSKCNYYVHGEMLVIEGWFLPVPDQVEVRNDNFLLGTARLGMPSQSIYNLYPEYNEKNSYWMFAMRTEGLLEHLEVHAIYGKECLKKVPCVCNSNNSYFRGGINYCVCDTAVNCLEVRGWYLPKVDKVEICNGEQLLGLATLGAQSKSIYNLYPEFHEEYSSWYFKNQINDVLSQITVNVFYGSECIESKTVEVKPIFEVKSGKSYCIKSEERIIAEGYFLPKPDEVKVFSGEKFLGSARTGISSKSLYDNFPEYNEKNAVWALGLSVNEEISSLRLEAFYGGICQKSLEMSIEKAQKPVKEGIKSCLYNYLTGMLSVEGWYLPKADKVEIWNEDKLLGLANINLQSKSIYNLYPEFEQEYSAWRFLTSTNDTVSKVTIKVYYGEQCVQEKTIEVEKNFLVKAGNSYCVGNEDRIIAEGYFLPKPDEVKVWSGTEFLGNARIGIESLSLYNSFPEYCEKNGGWVVSVCTGKPVEELRLEAIYAGTCQKTFDIPVSSIDEPVKGSVKICQYNLLTKVLHIEGWYLPKADKVEIWNGKQLLGVADVGLQNKSIYGLYPEFEEEYSSWRFLMHINDNVSEVMIKVYYGQQCVHSKVVEVERDYVVKVGTNFCIRNGKRVMAEGYILPKPDEVRIWAGTNLLGNARIGIESSSLYESFPEYREKYGAWAAGACVEEEISELRAEAIYNGNYIKNIEIPIENVMKPVKGAVGSCRYNLLTETIQMEGWYLPRPEKIEIWDSHCKIDEVTEIVENNSVFEKFVEFDERNAVWNYKKRIPGFKQSSIKLKLFYDNGNIFEESIKVVIEDPKVVSFDIFDTLLVRPVLIPTDMFKLLALRAGYDKSFQQLRIYAEKAARIENQGIKEDITLDDIYLQFIKLYGFSEAEAGRIKRIELEVEWDYLRPRKSIFEIFQRARGLEKKIVVVSDMYLPCDFLHDVLKKNGYDGIEKIFVSGAERVCKGTGNLFRQVIDLFSDKDVKAEDILHIGDNYHADITVPSKLGFQTAHFPKTVDVFKKKKYFSLYSYNLKSEMDNSFFAGYLANELFDDCFVQYDEETLFDGDFANIGKIIFAPVLLNYTLWMLRNMRQEGIEDLLLTYRDGYLLEKILDIINVYTNEKCHYQRLYLSRTIRYNAYVNRDNGFWQALIEYPVNNMSVGSFIRKRLLVEDDREASECFKIIHEKLNLNVDDAIGDMGNISIILKDVEPFYIKHAKENLTIIDDYCKAMLGTKSKAVFDVGYRGRTVNFLMENYDATCKGYQILGYSLMDKHEDGCDNTATYLSYGFGEVKKLKILHHLFEDVLCIQEGTAKGIQKVNDKYEILKEKASVNDKLAKIQSATLEMIQGFVELFSKDLFALEMERFPEFDLLREFLKSPNKKDAECIRELSFSDSEFIGCPGQTAYEEWYEEQFRSN